MDRRLLGACLVCCAACAVQAGEAPASAADPALQARVMAIAEEMRCLVCQNETLAASHSALAVDLRNQIGLQLEKGSSPQQVRDYMVERYGDFVLYRPPLQASTVLLWFGPFALLAAALLWLFRMLRRRALDPSATELGAAERERARRLLDSGAGSS